MKRAALITAAAIALAGCGGQSPQARAKAACQREWKNAPAQAQRQAEQAANNAEERAGGSALSTIDPITWARIVERTRRSLLAKYEREHHVNCHFPDGS